MRKKYNNKTKLHEFNKLNLFALYRTNTGKNNTCNCGTKVNKKPIIHKSFNNYHKRINEPWCNGDAYYKKNFKLKPNNNNYIEHKKACVINDPTTRRNHDHSDFNNMGNCKDGVIIKNPVITKDIQLYSNSEYIELKKSICKNTQFHSKTVMGNKKCNPV